jgi:hypothetical protein
MVVKVWHIITSINSGGVERIIFNIIKRNQQMYVNNNVVLLGDEGSYVVR